MIAFLPILMLLVFGAPSFSAMTPLLWVQFGLGQAQNIEEAIKIMKTPAFAKWAAANGDKAIQLQPGEVTER